MKTFAITGTEIFGQSTCLHCHQLIVEVADIGWVDPDLGDSYDLCPSDPFANHQPQQPAAYT